MSDRDVQLDTSPLFSPLNLGALQLRNRIAMSPMTRNFTRDGLPGPGVVDYYRRRASGGAGLIITEGVAPPHAVAQQVRASPIMSGEPAVASWPEGVRHRQCARALDWPVRISARTGTAGAGDGSQGFR